MTMETGDWQWQPPQGLKRKHPDSDSDTDESQADEDEAWRRKYYKLSDETLKELSKKGSGCSIRCTLSPPCSERPPFTSIQAYEDHYASCHTQVCSECSKILPTPRLLHLHLLEFHDKFFAAQVDQQDQKMYECFVDGCPKKCRTPDRRVLHLVYKHNFPMRFDFGIIRGAWPKPSRKIRSKIESEDTSTASKIDTFHDPKPVVSPVDPTENRDLMDLTSSFDQLSIPRSVRLAQRHKK